MAGIASAEDLRRVLPEPRPTTRAKILDALDEQSIAFLQRCLFALVGTADAKARSSSRPRATSPASSASMIPRRC